MAVYSRTQTSTQSNNNTSTMTTPQLPSVDIGTIIVKSFETASEALSDDKAFPVKIVDNKEAEKNNNNTREKQLDGLLKRRTAEFDEAKLNALLKSKGTQTNASSQISKTLNNLSSLLSKRELSENGAEKKERTSLSELISSGNRKMHEYQEKNLKELKSLKDMTLLSVIGKMVPTAVTTGAVLAGLPYAIREITKFIIDFPVNASKFSTWLKLALTGPDSVFVKFGRELKGLLNSVAVNMSASDNPVISALGAGIAKATGSNVTKKVVISPDTLSQDESGAIQGGIDYLNRITGNGLKTDENGNYVFDINDIQNKYLQQQLDTTLASEKKRLGGYRDYLSAGKTGTSILTDKLKEVNKSVNDEDIQAMLVSIDAGMFDLMDDINSAKKGATSTSGLRNSLISKLSSRAKEEGEDSSAGYLVKSFGGDAGKAVDAILSYLGANEGNKIAEAKYEEASKEFANATAGMTMFQRNFAEKADYSRDAARAKQEEEKAYIKAYQDEVQKHALLGDWSEMQWNEYLGDGSSEGSQRRQIAFQNYAKAGNSLTVKDKGPIENLHEKASERVEQNKQASGNFFTSVFGITPTQCVSSFNNIFN